MMWLLGGAYCFVLWLVFAKLKLLRLSLPLAIVLAAIGPSAILALLFCAQYYHPMSARVLAVQKVIPIVPQMNQPGRVTRIAIEPNTPLKTGDVLFEVDPVPYQNAVTRLTAALAEAEESVRLAEASVKVADATFERATGDLEFATSERDRYQKLSDANAATRQNLDRAVAQYEQASAAMNQATIGRQQSALSVELSRAKVRQAQSALDDATYDLEQTTVRSPSDGFVTNLQLQPGMLVGGPGAQAVMSFVQSRSHDDSGIVVAMFDQKNYLLVQPDQYTEVILDAYPGQILTGKVETTIDVSGAGQLAASGDLPDDLGAGPPTKFAVRIRLDDADSLRLPAGVSGKAAVYTEHVPIAGIPVMFVMRAQSWLNYVM